MQKLYTSIYNFFAPKSNKTSTNNPEAKLVPMPDKIPIARMEDYHTHYLGRSGRGMLFWAYETFTYSKPISEMATGEDWRTNRKEYALLHTFNPDGTYLATQHLFAGTADEVNNEILADKLANLVNALGGIEYCDIEIYLFQTVIDGVIFGLVADADSQTISLQPSSTISFQKPWDGEYYT